MRFCAGGDYFSCLSSLPADRINETVFAWTEDIRRADAWHLKDTANAIDHCLAHYDIEMHYVDAHVGRLMERLQRDTRKDQLKGFGYLQ